MIRATATQLKAKMGQYMKAVRSGKTIVVTDRQEPIASLIPFRKDNSPSGEPTICQERDPIAPALGDLQIVGISYRGKNTTILLKEDRRKR